MLTSCVGTARGDEHMKEIIAEADYAIAGSRSPERCFAPPKKEAEAAAQMGVGYSNLDIATAKELGIKVARTTGSNAVPVAEFALGLTLAALRNIGYGHAELRGTGPPASCRARPIRSRARRSASSASGRSARISQSC